MLKKAIIVLGVFLLCVGTLFYFKHRIWPYGIRTCCLPCMMGTLSFYAHEHDGWYPHDGKTGLESLQAFYYSDPQVLGNPELLAGISGDRKETAKRIELRLPIDETVSSWVYFPGFRSDDDSELAIIWERREGIRFNGERADGHAVGLADGGHVQIPQARWPEFLKKQEALRQTILARRTVRDSTNRPANPNR